LLPPPPPPPYCPRRRRRAADAAKLLPPPRRRQATAAKLPVGIIPSQKKESKFLYIWVQLFLGSKIRENSTEFWWIFLLERNPEKTQSFTHDCITVQNIQVTASTMIGQRFIWQQKKWTICPVKENFIVCMPNTFISILFLREESSWQW
jgi:hypothetical protein